MTMWFWNTRLRIYKDELGLLIGVLTDKREMNPGLLGLLDVVVAAAGDDTLATVYTLSRVEDEDSREESFGHHDVAPHGLYCSARKPEAL